MRQKDVCESEPLFDPFPPPLPPVTLDGCGKRKNKSGSGEFGSVYICERGVEVTLYGTLLTKLRLEEGEKKLLMELVRESPIDGARVERAAA